MIIENKRTTTNSFFLFVMQFEIHNKLEVEDTRPVGRPKKTWSKVVEEDMRKEDVVEDIENSGSNSYHVQFQEGDDIYINYILFLTINLLLMQVDFHTLS